MVIFLSNLGLESNSTNDQQYCTKKSLDDFFPDKFQRVTRQVTTNEEGKYEKIIFIKI